MVAVPSKVNNTNLLGKLLGKPVVVGERQVDFREYVKVLKDRVNTVVKLIGEDKVWVTW